MRTQIYHMSELSKGEAREAVEYAGRVIREGGLVAFPTETVYGLGADAMSADASRRIYAAKGRPSDNPLIVHIAKKEQAEEVAAKIPDSAGKLMEAFWPGPLTLILPKKAQVPDETTGGLSTVAIRLPAHPVARELIEKSGRLIAAPSANTSGRPSPTLAEHVRQDLSGRISVILDGGPVGIGIESTIVDMTGSTPVILRPGFITEEMIRTVTGRVVTDPAMKSKKAPTDVKAKAPGMKYKHYAPRGQLILVEGAGDKVTERIGQEAAGREKLGYKTVVLCTEETRDRYDPALTKCLGSRKDPGTIAAGLYRILRECDDCGADYIYSESFFEEGLGTAIMNRMLKAAGYQLITV